MRIGFLEVNCSSQMFIVSSLLSEAEEHFRKFKKDDCSNIYFTIFSTVKQHYSIQEICETFVFRKLASQFPYEFPFATR